jgi:hypothetical protein
MYHITGFTKAEITELCARIEARELSPRVRRWPPILGLHNAQRQHLGHLRGLARPRRQDRRGEPLPVAGAVPGGDAGRGPGARIVAWNGIAAARRPRAGPPTPRPSTGKSSTPGCGSKDPPTPTPTPSVRPSGGLPADGDLAIRSLLQVPRQEQPSQRQAYSERSGRAGATLRSIPRALSWASCSAPAPPRHRPGERRYQRACAVCLPDGARLHRQILTMA